MQPWAPSQGPPVPALQVTPLQAIAVLRAGLAVEAATRRGWRAGVVAGGRRRSLATSTAC
jgi:hypothetical protein